MTYEDVVEFVREKSVYEILHDVEKVLRYEFSEYETVYSLWISNNVIISTDGTVYFVTDEDYDMKMLPEDCISKLNEVSEMLDVVMQKVR